MNRMTFRGGLWPLIVLVLACVQGAVTSSGQTAAPAQTPPPATEYPNLNAQAKEYLDGFVQKDLKKILKFTLPKVIDYFGGQGSFVMHLKTELRADDVDGFSYVSYTAETPSQIIKTAPEIYAVVPTAARIKTTEGVFQARGCLLAASSDNGNNWTYVWVSGKNKKLDETLKVWLPNAAGKLEPCEETPPVRVDKE